MNVRCLILDHDDTVVNSTATIHYPCFTEYLAIHRPALVGRWTLRDYFERNFHPGVVSFFREEVGYTEEEFAGEQAYWYSYVDRHIPTAYAGISDVLKKFRAAGGFIAVDSHSFSRYIERDYRENGLPAPDVIYGWEIAPEMRKPNPATLFDLMERFGFSPSEMLVVDDLRPGLDMARAAGVPFAAAGWGYDVPAIRDYMTSHADHYLSSVADLAALLGLEG